MTYLQEHAIGFIIIGLSVVLSAGLLLWRWRDWRNTWGVAGEYGRRKTLWSTWVDWEIERQLPIVNGIIDRHIDTRYPRQADSFKDFWIEIVERGTMGTDPENGREVAATLRKVRMLPWTKETDVVEVAADGLTAELVIHEVIAHLIPMRFGMGRNHAHDNAELGLIEKALKAQLRRALRL